MASPQHKPAPRLPDNPLELRCETCGSDQIAHAPSPWRRSNPETLGNLCLQCGAVTDYLPTLAEIRRAARSEKSASRLDPGTDAHPALALKSIDAIHWEGPLAGEIPDDRDQLAALWFALPDAPLARRDRLPDLAKEWVSIWLAELQLAVILVDGLEARGIFRIHDVLAAGEEKLLAIPQLGRKRIDILTAACKRARLSVFGATQ